MMTGKRGSAGHEVWTHGVFPLGASARESGAGDARCDASGRQGGVVGGHVLVPRWVHARHDMRVHVQRDGWQPLGVLGAPFGARKWPCSCPGSSGFPFLVGPPKGGFEPPNLTFLAINVWEPLTFFSFSPFFASVRAKERNRERGRGRS